MFPTRIKKRPGAPSIQSVSVPAPVGGINTLSPGGGSSTGDCIYLYNMIGAEYGLRSRLGYQEWCTNLDGPVCSTVPFAGSYKNGSTDKIFGCTSTGIWDVTVKSSSPTKVEPFAITTDNSGWGVSCITSTPAGRFLIYCDEENGAYLYTENTDTWTKLTLGITQGWLALTGVTAGAKVINNGKVYLCAVGGVTGNTGGPTGTSTGILDGSVTWDYLSAAGSSGVIGPSLADQANGFTADPANFVACTVFKNRVWFVERDTTRAWYLEINSIYGTATSFDFGMRMPNGGTLVGLYNWSYDGGSGMDTLLAAISSAGDVAIYQGTDPTSANTFSLKGTWYLGGVVSGRKIATDSGGDVLIMSTLGVIPLSKLVLGNSIQNVSLYETHKIANLFNKLASLYGNLKGWSIVVHPTDNALLLTIPFAENQPTSQLAMSFSTQGWSQYRDLPIYSAGTLRGQMYFGTVDGKVCINTGYVDAVSLDDPTQYTPVDYSLLSTYQDLGNGRNKRIVMIRPTILAETPSANFEVSAKFGFSLTEADQPATISPLPGTWDAAIWDTTTWQGEFSPSQPMSGAMGIGRDVAIALRGKANCRTVFAGATIYFDQGGPL